MRMNKKDNEKRNIKNHFKKHKKKYAIGGGILIAILSYIGYKSIPSEVEKYSPEWFNNASDDTLDAEREIVRQEYCSAGENFTLAVQLENLLRKFDSIMSKRAWGDQEPTGPSYSREHGHNLYKSE